MPPKRANARDADLPGLAAEQLEQPGQLEPLEQIEQVDRLLPQTQCRRCGFQGCRPYAEAIAAGRAPINRCPPGGAATLEALALLLGVDVIALDPSCGGAQSRHVARIDNNVCIGCTKCIVACPVDAIIGAPKHQHHVLADRCTGCDLCLPPCPVDCISMAVVDHEWTPADARRGRRHHRARLVRLAAAISRTPSSGDGRGEPAEAADPAGLEAPSENAVVHRDPLIALSTPAEKARRLAQILDRARSAGAR